jgi:hypothetical protein
MSLQNPYDLFRRVARVWCFLMMKKRMGQEHGIDQLLPFRPPGNLVLYCPACPKIGFNIPRDQKPVPAWAR